MNALPILFSPPMVAAIIEGRKTQTRRLLYRTPSPARGSLGLMRSPWARIEPGTVLWVRERHWRWGKWVRDGKTPAGRQRWRFRADRDASPRFSEPARLGKRGSNRKGWFLRPSIFLPRRHARLFVRVAQVRTERLQAITESDARAEGVDKQFIVSIRIGGIGHDLRIPNSHRGGFYAIWTKLNGKRSWHDNPEVVVLDFALMSEIGDFPPMNIPA